MDKSYTMLFDDISPIITRIVKRQSKFSSTDIKEIKHYVRDSIQRNNPILYVTKNDLQNPYVV